MRAKTRTPARPNARPGARLAREEGAIVKDWGGRLPIALIYPNTYYIGMSNLGVHAIYSLLNGYNKLVCERVFLEEHERKLPLSVETERPLTDFAVMAFSVSYELDYFNIVLILKAAGIPLYAADRDESHPLIIAGGPCVTTNPMPLSPFFDCMCLGEAEAILPAMLPVLLESISDERSELLGKLAGLPGVFIPSQPPDKPVCRQWVKDPEDFGATSVIFTPDTELGDLYLIEAERGCQRGCRFCLVNTACSPRRFRPVERLLEQAREGLKTHKRIGLVGPAVADHPQIEALLKGLNDAGAEISISSLRISSLTSGLLDELARGSTQTITLAPEAGSRRLRRVINKDISDEEILAAIGMLSGEGFRQLKLYFMLGLPGETDADADAIAKLALDIKARLEQDHSQTRITINIAPFVPKASTPFQWMPMTPIDTLNDRLARLKRTLPPKGIRVNAESPAWSQIQGVLARGGAELAGLLENIGGVSLARWRRAVKEYRIDMDYYVNQRLDTARVLPWHMIDPGVTTEHLKKELEKALAEAAKP